MVAITTETAKFDGGEDDISFLFPHKLDAGKTAIDDCVAERVVFSVVSVESGHDFFRVIPQFPKILCFG